ncbi:hypothetical protein M2454_000134 [Aequitasia blattaphilus]|uniref:Uncharacterized protein n=1 Tax=Aequitasia blattaphilus TaxID=2949332 RepID=A0ABT1E4Z9_9FIRM|nr:hypothetical protein [Aequitasia blattaphilus]MCP1100918.1 hypothetical protein [Aequitasia blattaphilus]MCR8613558.1 hypothetical protein [Aequitasia blattaphilus]
MKENRVMRIVAFLLLGGLVSTAIVSGVTARYTSKKEGSYSAKVAPSGVLTATTGTLFHETVEPNTTSPEGGLTLGVHGVSEMRGEVLCSVDYQNIFLGEGVWGIMIPDESVTEESYGYRTYYTFDSTREVYTIEDTFAPDKVYYYMENEVYVEPGGYWPIAFQIADNSGGYVVQEDAKTTTNTLEEAVNVMESGVTGTFEAYENLTDRFGNQNITWSWMNCIRDNFCEKNGIVIEGGEGSEGNICDNCKRDRIIQNLMNGSTASVVRKESEEPEITYKIQDHTSDRCNLNVDLNLNIVVNQID